LNPIDINHTDIDNDNIVKEY